MCLHNQLSSFNSIIVHMSEKRDSSNNLNDNNNISISSVTSLFAHLSEEAEFVREVLWKNTCLETGALPQINVCRNPENGRKTLYSEPFRIFKIPFHFRDRHIFMWQSVKVSNVFNILTLKQIFSKTKTFFKKLEYQFLVETTKTENTSFPFKTAVSEANFKTNRMATTKWIYHNEWSFTSNCFIFLENLFQF